MKLFAFISERGGVIDVTTVPDGENLPRSFQPWTKVDDDAWSISEVASPEFTKAVERDGFYLMASCRGAQRSPVQVEVRRKKRNVTS
jgi:hypothetical protein